MRWRAPARWAAACTRQAPSISATIRCRPGREEAWRFTPLKRLRGLHDGTFVPGGGARVEVEAPPTVRWELVDRDDPRLGRIYIPNDRVAAQAWDSFDQARVLSVPAGHELDQPVLLNVFGAGSDAAVFNHLVIDIGANARATIVLQHQGSTTRAGNAEIIVGDGASLMLVSVQDWDDDAVHLAHLHARVGRDAGTGRRWSASAATWSGSPPPSTSLIRAERRSC